MAHLFFLVLPALSLARAAFGVVVDQNGAVIPAASVVATAENGERREAKSDEAGRFAIGELRPGSTHSRSLPTGSSTRESLVFKCFARSKHDWEQLSSRWLQSADVRRHSRW
jgi:hypothetical protein